MESLIVYFFQGAALGISAAATPGPLQSYLISQTLIGGWKRGAPAAFAPLISDPPVVFLIVFVLNQIPAEFLSVIGILGGSFALYIAYGLIRDWRHKMIKSEQTNPGQPEIPVHANDEVSPQNQNMKHLTAKQSTFSILGKAVGMNVLSPGLYFFWTLINGPLLLSMLETSTMSGISFILGFYLLITGGLLIIVFTFNFARRLGPRVVRVLTLLSIIVMVIFGIALLVRGVSNIVM